MAEQITTEEWLGELNRLETGVNSGGLSAREISVLTKRSVYWVRAKLRILLGMGVLAVGRRMEMRIDGVPTQVATYRIIKRPTARKIKKRR